MAWRRIGPGLVRLGCDSRGCREYVGRSYRPAEVSLDTARDAVTIEAVCDGWTAERGVWLCPVHARRVRALPVDG